MAVHFLKNRFLVIGILFLFAPGAAWAWTGDPWAPITRATIISNASMMIDATWTPNQTFTNWQQSSIYYTLNNGVVYTGEAYTQNDPQEDWAEFSNSVVTTTGGSVRYGNDCSGFVSICWQLPARENTTKFETELGTYWVSLGDIGSAASIPLLPGDALNWPGTHMCMFLAYTNGGILTMEQYPPNCQRRVRSFSDLSNFRPIRRLNILETLEIALNGNCAFGNVLLGSNAKCNLTIQNVGISALVVSNLNLPAGFSGNWSGTIAAGGTQNVTITFTPAALQTYGGTLTVNSDAIIGTNTLAISGNGTAAMEQLLVVAPGESATFGVAPGKSGTPNPEYSTVGYAVTIYALDANYNLITNLTDQVGLSSSANGDGLPANAALAGGSKIFTVTNNTVGSVTLTASDTSGGALSAGNTMIPVSLNNTVTTLASSANPASEGQAITLMATVGGAGVKTGTVIFRNGLATIGTGMVSNGAATLTTSGGVGTNFITAVYSGDANNRGSSSAALSQVINSAAAVKLTNNYASAGNAFWTCPSNITSVLVEATGGGGGGGGTGANYNEAGGGGGGAYVRYAVSVVPGSNYNLMIGVGGAGGSGTVGASTNGGVSCFGNAVAGVSTGASVLALGGVGGATANNANSTTNSRFGSAGGTNLSSSADVPGSSAQTGYLNYAGISGANGVSGTSAGTTSSGAGGNGAGPSGISGGGAGGTALPGGTSKLGNNGTAPGGGGGGGLRVTIAGQAGGSGAEGKITLTYASLLATKLVFSPAPQTLIEGSNSALITVTLEDESNNVFRASMDLIVNLSCDTDSGSFFSSTDGVTAIISTIIPSNMTSATFYFNDGAMGSPTIIAANGLLFPAAQMETVTAIPLNFTPAFITSFTGAGPYRASMLFYGSTNLQYHVRRSTDLNTWTSPGDAVTADDSGTIHYTDTNAPAVSAYYRLVYP